MSHFGRDSKLSQSNRERSREGEKEFCMRRRCILLWAVFFANLNVPIRTNLLSIKNEQIRDQQEIRVLVRGDANVYAGKLFKAEPF